VPLSEQEAWDLAQFLKRTGFADFRSQAADDQEAYRMQAVAEKLKINLAVIGYEPR
jgi:cytochrome c